MPGLFGEPEPPAFRPAEPVGPRVACVLYRGSGRGLRSRGMTSAQFAGEFGDPQAGLNGQQHHGLVASAFQRLRQQRPAG